MRVSVIVSAALLSLLPLACEENKPAQDPSQQNQYAGQNGQYPPGQYPPGQYQQQPTATAPMNTAPPAQTAPPASTGGQATPMAPAAAMAADAVLTGLAQQEAGGAQPEGTTFAGQFAEGQTLEQPVNLQPGKCYTVVGGSLGGVQELDVMIQGQLAPLPPTTLAQDNQTGPNATLGGKAAGCWKNPSPIPIPAKIILRVTKGSGMAAAKVYVK